MNEAVQSGTKTGALPQPEPGLKPQDLWDRAIGMRQKIRDEQAASEERGTYSPELHAEFMKNGFYRITQPKLFGGYEFPLPVFSRTMLEIARGDPGTAWCLALCASHSFIVGAHWSEEGQRQLFGPDGVFIAGHRALPSGKAEKVSGGWKLTGRWNYCSGSPYSTHMVFNAICDDKVQRCFVVPKKDFTIIDDWGGDKTLGMAASGSNSIEVKDAFIPEALVTYNMIGLQPEAVQGGTPGTRLHNNPFFLGLIQGPYHCTLVGCVIGAAWAAIDEYERVTMSQNDYRQADTRRAELQDHQREMGLALSMADAAQAIFLGAAQGYMDLCHAWQGGYQITQEDSFRLHGMAQQAGKMGSEVVERLFHVMGAFATKKGNRMQRYFRDIGMYRTHSAAQYMQLASLTGKSHFGINAIYRSVDA